MNDALGRLRELLDLNRIEAIIWAGAIGQHAGSDDIAEQEALRAVAIDYVCGHLGIHVGSWSKHLEHAVLSQRVPQLRWERAPLEKMSESVLQRFACDCACRALRHAKGDDAYEHAPGWKAIRIARRIIRGETDAHAARNIVWSELLELQERLPAGVFSNAIRSVRWALYSDSHSAAIMARGSSLAAMELWGVLYDNGWLDRLRAKRNIGQQEEEWAMQRLALLCRWVALGRIR